MRKISLIALLIIMGLMFNCSSEEKKPEEMEIPEPTKKVEDQEDIEEDIDFDEEEANEYYKTGEESYKQYQRSNDKKDLKKAIRNYKRGLDLYEIEKRKKELMLIYASHSTNTKDLEKSHKYLTELYKEDKFNEDALYGLGVIYYRYKQFKYAKSFLEAFIKISKEKSYNRFRALTFIGNIHIMNKNPKPAISTLFEANNKQYEAYQVNNKEALVSLATAYYMARNFDESKRILEFVLEVDPQNKKAQASLQNLNNYLRYN